MPTPQTIRAMREAVGHHQAGRLGEAERIYIRVLQQHPRDEDALQLLGLVHHQTGRNESAVDLISRAIAIRPDGHFYVNLSQAQLALGRKRDALESCRRAVQLVSSVTEAWNNLGSLLHQMGQAAEAVTALEKAIALRPQNPIAYNNLGNALSRLGRGDDAAAALKRAIEIDPNYAPAYVNIANLLTRTSRLDDSIEMSRKAIAAGAHAAQAYGNLGVALHIQGWFDQGNQALERGVELNPNEPITAENLLGGMAYTTRYSQQQVFDAHLKWAEKFADPLTPAAPQFAPRVQKLRIGYLSPDLKRHSVSYFFEPILEHHDRANFEVTAYSATEGPDEVTQRLRGRCDHWRDIVAMTDDEAAQQIRADGIDIIIDLAGHTVGNRLLVLARRPAPVQMTYLGYPGTTGMRAIDYRITDALADPPGESDAHHTERLLRVTAPFVRYRPPAEAPPVVDPPMLKNGYVTFGSFNKAAKAGSEAIALWSKVLAAVPASRLIMKAVGLSSQGSRRRLLDGFSAHGIDVSRIELIEAAQSLADHLAMYGRIDLSLDTFPYHGTTTTCEALWMGVPVLSLAGGTHVSRVGLSLLSAIGRSAWCATSEADFVYMASQMSGDAQALRQERQALRETLKSSPLCDYAGLTRELEALYRQSFIAWATDQRYI